VPYTFLGALIGFIVGSIAGALIAPRRWRDILESSRIRFRKSRLEANAAADHAEQELRKSLKEGQRREVE